MTQDEFDKAIDLLIKNNNRDEIWNTCALTEGLNYNKVIDYYVDTRDSFYIAELVSILAEDLDNEYLVNKMINTQDKDFIRESLNYCNKIMQYSIDPICLEKLLEYVK